MPPREASAPGSIGKKRPVSCRKSLSCLRVTPGSTTQSRSSALTAITLFMREQSSDTPPCGALTWPSSDEPIPKGTIGASRLAQIFTRSITSSRDFGEHHRVRRLVLEPGQGVAMGLANRLRGGEAIAESRRQIGVEGGDGLGRQAAVALADGGKGVCHGFAPLVPAGDKDRRAGAAWLVKLPKWAAPATALRRSRTGGGAADFRKGAG